MSTRSIVAAEFEDGVKGVYVHSDGYPEGQWGMLNQLSTKIARDGAAKVIKTILGKPSGWSSLIEHDELPSGHTDGRFLLIKGYGVQFSRKLFPKLGKDYRQGDDTYRYPGDGGEEYFYLIRRDGTIEWCEGDWPVTSKINTHKVEELVK